MLRNRLLRSLTTGLLAVAVGSMGSCGGSEDYLILVRVTGMPADSMALSVTAKLGEQYAKSGADITPPMPLSYFALRLPSASSGMATLEVSALGTDLCKAASGTVTVDLDEGRGQEVTVNLAALSPRRCSLLIEQSGEGSVSVTPAGTPCGTGCYDFNQGQTAVLKFNATGKSYGRPDVHKLGRNLRRLQRLLGQRRQAGPRRSKVSAATLFAVEVVLVSPASARQRIKRNVGHRTDGHLGGGRLRNRASL
jgi:hypothetical protein